MHFPFPKQWDETHPVMSQETFYKVCFHSSFPIIDCYSKANAQNTLPFYE